MRWRITVMAVGVALAFGGPEGAQACSVCFGAPGVENPDTAGLNAGVAVLFVALAMVQIPLGVLFLRLLRGPLAGKEAKP